MIRLFEVFCLVINSSLFRTMLLLNFKHLGSFIFIITECVLDSDASSSDHLCNILDVFGREPTLRKGRNNFGMVASLDGKSGQRGQLGDLAIVPIARSKCVSTSGFAEIQ